MEWEAYYREYKVEKKGENTEQRGYRVTVITCSILCMERKS